MCCFRRPLNLTVSLGMVGIAASLIGGAPFLKAAAAGEAPPSLPEVHAHRGGAGLAPENTLAAFRKALDLDVDVLEMDMQVTRDGEIVIIHDDSLDRTTDGRGRVTDFTLTELKQRDAGRHFGWQFKGEPIPTLREVIALVRSSGNTRVRLNIETKFAKGQEGTPADFEEKVLAILRESGFVERTILQSFYYPSLAKMKTLEPRVKLALLMGGNQAPRDPVELVRQHQADYYSCDLRQVTSGLVSALHNAGLPVVPWTVNEEAEVRRLLDAGVGKLAGDGIITNYPDRVLNLLKVRR
ncbi:MAG TPA: glycerophosphodiester phosphodiesterase family protein [Candidatus Methylomirabilis sp.]|nr:glycerophosphodiester phosphodiesterase family protein [Candidatus Methylomirabilis sp.]